MSALLASSGLAAIHDTVAMGWDPETELRRHKQLEPMPSAVWGVSSDGHSGEFKASCNTVD